MNKDIDREIAEKVMKWMLGGATVDPMSYPVWWDVANKKIVDGLETWQPSKNIDQAFEVVEKMLNMNWEFVIIWLNKLGKWRAAFGENQGNDRTPAMAICLAALKALNEENTNGTKRIDKKKVPAKLAIGSEREGEMRNERI